MTDRPDAGGEGGTVAHAAGEREPPLVLVADDEAEIREVIVDLLAQSGLRTVTARDGEEAVLLARERLPALILLDVMMPVMDGYTALTRLRGDPATRDIPVIVLTGQAARAYPGVSIGVGAVAHIAKPFSPGGLTEAVRRVLAERAQDLEEERRLVELLLERSFVTAEQLQEAEQTRRREGTRRLPQILLEMMAVSPDQLNRARAELFGLPRVEFRETSVDLELARALPEALLRRHRAFPLRRDGDRLAVLLVDPANRQAVAELEELTGATVVTAIAFRDTIDRLLDRAFPPGDAGRTAPARDDRAADLALDLEPTGVGSVFPLLLGALREGAGEIRFEPRGEEVRVRYRLEGGLVDRARLPGRALPAVVGRLRLLARLGDEPAPLHAYARTRLDGLPVELELDFEPTPHGEAATVRLWRGGLADPEHILAAAAEAGASEILLLEGAPPTFKVEGVAVPLVDARPLGAADLRKLASSLVAVHRIEALTATGEADLSFVHPEWGRFRLSAYRTLGATGMVLRPAKTQVPSLATLGLPPGLGALVLERRGLVLVVGASGSGKSTTVAAMLDHRNSRLPGHIVTIEDPVEFLHARKQSLVSQREVGLDTDSYHVGLERALRHAPDVIFVGELRDRDTVATALHAAETRHLVLSTLYAGDATAAIERLTGFFPPEAREGLLVQLSLSLRAVIAQRLVPRADGKGRVPALEIVVNTPRVQTLLRRGELEPLRQAMEEGVHEGLQTGDQALLALYRERKITQEDALRFADSPDKLRLRMKGAR